MMKRMKHIADMTWAERLCLIMGLFFLLSLIPLLLLALCSHPAGDDFSYGLLAHHAWESTHSLLEVLKAAVQNTINYYQSWQGTYSSIFLMSLQPAVISDRLYPLTAVVMLAMLIGSHLCLFRVLFTRYLPLGRSVRLMTSLSVLFLSIQVLDSAGAAFFWYNGALHYVFMHSCMLFLLACLLLCLKTERRGRRALLLLLSCALAFITGGANFVTALITPILLAFLLLFCLLLRQKRALLCLPPLLITTAGLLVSVTAPGNAVRQAEQAASLGAPSAIYWSFIYAFEGIGDWTNVYVLFFALLLLPFLLRELSRTDFSFPLPGAAAALSYCVIAASYTPSLYSMGHVVIFERTLNIMRMLYYLLFFLNLIYSAGWLCARCRQYGLRESAISLLARLKKGCGRSFCLGMSLFFLSLLVFSDKNKLTSLSAAHSLLKGYAQSYHEESLNRIALLTMEGVDEVWVPNFSVCPPLLNPQELSTDPDTYPNTALAEWYGVKTIHYSIIY